MGNSGKYLAVAATMLFLGLLLAGCAPSYHCLLWLLCYLQILRATALAFCALFELCLPFMCGDQAFVRSSGSYEPDFTAER